MRTIELGGETHELSFTTWSIREFHRMTGVNLYSEEGISKVFNESHDTIEQMDLIAKLIYCLIASAKLPKNAPDDWKPDFTWNWVLRNIPMNDSAGVFNKILEAYFDRDIADIRQEQDDKKKEEAVTAE